MTFEGPPSTGKSPEACGHSLQSGTLLGYLFWFAYIPQEGTTWGLPEVSPVAPGTAQSQAPPPPPLPTAGAAPGFFQTTGPWVAGNLYTVVPTAPLSPVPDQGERWFSVTRGKYVGLTKNSAISLNAVTGVSTGMTARFSTQTEAISNFNGALHSGVVAIL
ncbi:hypothetical protein B0H13DRAFT_2370003 [Mycena leptocephala]|nr:hypothetical protein B0H13DRAFT_2370003 [Mycena leptocephala]